jgi:hypothetical protein
MPVHHPIDNLLSVAGEVQEAYGEHFAENEFKPEWGNLKMWIQQISQALTELNKGIDAADKDKLIAFVTKFDYRTNPDDPGDKGLLTKLSDGNHPLRELLDVTNKQNEFIKALNEAVTYIKGPHVLDLMVNVGGGYHRKTKRRRFKRRCSKKHFSPR